MIWILAAYACIVLAWGYGEWRVERESKRVDRLHDTLPREPRR